MNKPVAWMRESDKDCVSDKAKNELLEEEGKDWNYVIPLYTNPVKELTDEEIEKIANENLGDSFDCDIMWMRMFVKAILRKAQEK